MKKKRTPDHTVVWSHVARKDLEHIIRFVAARESAPRASGLLRKIKGRIDSLVRTPDRGRKVPELDVFPKKPHREIIVFPYRIIYLVRKNEVYIVAVLDGRRDLHDILAERAMAVVREKIPQKNTNPNP